VRKRLLIVKTGTTLPELRAQRGDYEAWIAAGMGLEEDEVDVVAVAAGGMLPAPESPAGVVITGSSAMVSQREPWSERTAGWLLRAVELRTPVLGICFGHQLLAHALGGEVGRNPRGREIGTVEVRGLPPAQRDPLLGVWGSAEPAHVTHIESVLALPAGAVRLAESDLDPVQAFSVGERAWGVQFHPEFDADTVRAYLEARREKVRNEGRDPDALLDQVRDTPGGPRLLRRFAELVRPRAER
jgi:GMP synthase (glutamine-hydrolysing)